MAYVTIPDLTSGVALTGTEQFEAVQSAASVRLTATQMKTFINTRYYAAYYDLTDQTAVANTPTAIKFNTSYLSNGIAVSNDGSGNPTKITFTNAGLYNLNVNVQLANSAAADCLVRFWQKLDGVDAAGTTSSTVAPKTADGGCATYNLTLLGNFTAGQYVQFYWATAAATTTLDYSAAITSPYAAPVQPSAIFTAFSITY
jgi:hypothetical protein